MRISRILTTSLLAGLVTLCAQTTSQITTGYTRLQNELGSANVPTASTLSVSQTEAPVTTGGVDFAPDAGNSQFAGKTFTLTPSNGTTYNSGTTINHATGVGQLFYGLTSSFSPGPTDIRVYSANGWLSYIQNTASGTVSIDGTYASNHSWIGSFKSDTNTQAEADANATTFYRTLDFVVQNRSPKPLIVAGENNGASTTLPQLLGQGYNLISVGRSDGKHSAGYTTVDIAGRIKPDIVAPASTTSEATPMVASAGLLLRAKATGSLATANDPRAIKAILLATASKYKYPAWAQTTKRPLDLIYGAGELNVYNAYRVLAAGRQSYSTSVVRAARGWDLNNTTSNAAGRSYFFDIPAGDTASRFATALVWHRNIASDLTPTLPNLTLTLYQANGTTLGDLVTQSASDIDNLEHLYQATLSPGRYAIVVTSDTDAATYGLAWFTAPTIALTTIAPSAFVRDGSATVTYTFTRNGGDTSLPVELSLLADGTAIAGTDFTPAIPSTLTLPANQTSVSLTVTPLAAATKNTAPVTLALSLANDFAYAPDATNNAVTTTLYANAYSEWRYARFSTAELADSAVSGDTADPDADGIANLVEYALATEPLAPDASTVLPQPAVAGDHLTLSYPATRSDLLYTPLWSPDLGSWYSGSSYTTETSDGDTITSTAVSPLTGQPRQFMRLQIERQ